MKNKVIENIIMALVAGPIGQYIATLIIPDIKFWEELPSTILFVFLGACTLDWFNQNKNK